MNKYFIFLTTNDPQLGGTLFSKMKTMFSAGAYVNEGGYIIISTLSAIEVRNLISKELGPSDSMLVLEIGESIAAYHVPLQFKEWLQKIKDKQVQSQAAPVVAQPAPQKEEAPTAAQQNPEETQAASKSKQKGSQMPQAAIPAEKIIRNN